jgi:hypothetical protein
MRFLFTFLLFSCCAASNAQIPSYVPTNGLVGWWPFNGNANDESGNGNNGVVYGATLTSDRFGNIGKAYSFDGVSNYIKTLGSSQYNNTTISLNVWLKIPDIISGGIQFIVNGNTNNAIWSIFCDNLGFGNLINQGCSGYSSNNFGNIPLPNQWINVTFLITPSNTTFYKDGVFISTFPNTTINLNCSNSTGLYFGLDVIVDMEYFKGSLDDIAIYNRALTQQEISQLYTGTVTPPTPEDTTSNVGIGTTNPKRKLHVNDVMRLEPRSSAPANPGEGDIYYDAILKKLRYYNGTNWINL